MSTGPTDRRRTPPRPPTPRRRHRAGRRRRGEQRLATPVSGGGCRRATPTDAARVPLRVVWYNVHGLRDDAAALAGVVREAAPDVVIVQEAPRRFRWRQSPRCWPTRSAWWWPPGACLAGQPAADQPAGPGDTRRTGHAVPADPGPAPARRGVRPLHGAAGPGSWWPARTWPPTRPNAPARPRCSSGAGRERPAGGLRGRPQRGPGRRGLGHRRGRADRRRDRRRRGRPAHLLVHRPAPAHRRPLRGPARRRWSATRWWTPRRPAGPATTSRSWSTCCCPPADRPGLRRPGRPSAAGRGSAAVGPTPCEPGGPGLRVGEDAREPATWPHKRRSRCRPPPSTAGPIRRPRRAPPSRTAAGLRPGRHRLRDRRRRQPA